MTIAVCYVSPEGVVLGADSTSSYLSGQHMHYFNHGQKLFEVGGPFPMGIVTWGLGGLRLDSYRTLIANFSDELEKSVPADAAELVDRWSAFFWGKYCAALDAERKILDSLSKKSVYSQANPPAPDARTEAEEVQFERLSNDLVVGFCLAGCDPKSRAPFASEVICAPLASAATVRPVPLGSLHCWGVPNLINRLMLGCDLQLRDEILTSGKWTGNEADLNQLISKFVLQFALLPIREAVDLAHTAIFSTIKALKFSGYPQVCGGPIEIAVITTDRPFRWVRHKSFDAAIAEGGL